MQLRLTVLLLGLVISGSASTEPEELQDVLEQMISAYGGEMNLRKLDSVIQEWDLFALSRNKQGNDKRSIQFPDRLKVELTYPDKQETRILNGDAGLVVFGDRAPTLANDMQRDAMRLQLMRLFSPLTLRERADSLRLSADDDHLTLTLTEHKLRVVYFVNAEDWRVEKVVGTLTINGGEMDFVTEYSDFAVVEGVLVHHRENKYAGGVNTAVLRLRRIEFDAKLDDEDFQVPENDKESVIATVTSTTTYARE